MQNNLNKHIPLLISILMFFAIILSAVFSNFSPNMQVANLMSFFNKSKLYKENLKLKDDLLRLKSELNSMKMSFVLPADDRFIEANVFSFYPFKFRNLLYITAGSYNGVKNGDAVTFNKNILIGVVNNVGEYKSEVTTIFNKNFSMPVYIGKNKIVGLLKGGINPIITLIDKSKSINKGDLVISSSKDIPFGLIIGNISKVYIDDSGSFLQAELLLKYSLSQLRKVYVVK